MPLGHFRGLCTATLLPLRQAAKAATGRRGGRACKQGKEPKGLFVCGEGAAWGLPGGVAVAVPVAPHRPELCPAARTAGSDWNRGVPAGCRRGPGGGLTLTPLTPLSLSSPALAYILSVTAAGVRRETKREGVSLSADRSSRTPPPTRATTRESAQQGRNPHRAAPRGARICRVSG